LKYKLELVCKHIRISRITKRIDHAQLHVKIAWHCTLLNLYKSRAPIKCNNLSAEFEALMGKIQI